MGIRILSLGDGDDGAVLRVAEGAGAEGEVAAGEAHATTSAMTDESQSRARIR